MEQRRDPYGQHEAIALLPPPHVGDVQQRAPADVHEAREAADRTRWRARPLSPGVLGSMLFLELGIIAAFAILTWLSGKKKGFVAIGGDFDISVGVDNHAARKSLRRTFLWTTMPTLLMTLFALAWGAIVSAYGDEMPIRALQRGDTLEKTVCQDYRKTPSFYNWIVAWHNRHVLLGFCMALAFVNTIALVPLAAHLFEVTAPALDKHAIFPQTTVYNESRLVSLLDYQPIIAIVSAVRLYGGNWPNATDGAYAFPDFEQPVQATANSTQYNVSTTANSAEVNCSRLTEYSLVRNPPNGDTATIALNASDRGCPISMTMGVGPGNAIYLRTGSNVACPDGAGDSRISFLAGAYSSSSTYLLDQISVISCIPNYYQTSGIMSSPPSFQPLTFVPDSSTKADARPLNWRIFEQQLVSLSNIGNNNSPDFTSQFGELILNMVRSSGADVLDADALLNNTAIAFGSVFATLARTYLFSSADSGATADGTLEYSQTRLATVPWSMYTSIAIVAVMVALTSILMTIIPRQSPVLAEDPQGLLGAAALLHQSNLRELVQNAGWRGDQYRGRFQKWLKDTYVLGQERCTIDRAGMVEIQDLTLRPTAAGRGLR